MGNVGDGPQDERVERLDVARQVVPGHAPVRGLPDLVAVDQVGDAGILVDDRVTHREARARRRVGGRQPERPRAIADVDVVTGTHDHEIRVAGVAVAEGVEAGAVGGHRRDRRHVVALVERLEDPVAATDEDPVLVYGVELDRGREPTDHRAATQHVQAHGDRADEVVAGIPERTPEAQQKLGARVAHRNARRGGRVDRHVAAVAAGPEEPGQVVELVLHRRAVVLGAGHVDLGEAVEGEVMQLGRPDVAVERNPVTPVAARVGAFVDTAVIAFDELTGGGEDHLARIGVRRAVRRRTTARRAQRPGVGQVGGLATRGPRGIDPEQTAREVDGANRIGEETGKSLLVARGLTVTAHVDDIRVARIGDDRHVDRTLTARMDADVVRAGGRQVERRPGVAAVAGAEETRQASGVDDRRVGVVVLTHGHLDVASQARDQQRVDGVVGDLGPRRAGVVTAVEAVLAAQEVGEVDVGKKSLSIVRVADEVVGDAARQTRGGAVTDRDPGERGPAVGRTKDADVADVGNVGDVDRHDDGRTPRRDAGDVFTDQDAATVDRIPGVATVDGAQQTGASATEAEAAESTDAGHQGLGACVGGIEIDRADRKRGLEVGLAHPLDVRRIDVDALPDTAVDTAGIENLGVRRMSDNDVDGTHGFVAGGDVLDLRG